MVHYGMENAVRKSDILDALTKFEAGQPAKLRDLNEQLSTSATVAAEAAMKISGNPLDEPGQLLSKAAAQGIITRDELVDWDQRPEKSLRCKRR
jgi:hypothetical protein